PGRPSAAAPPGGLEAAEPATGPWLRAAVQGACGIEAAGAAAARRRGAAPAEAEAGVAVGVGGFEPGAAPAPAGPARLAAALTGLAAADAAAWRRTRRAEAAPWPAALGTRARRGQGAP